MADYPNNNFMIWAVDWLIFKKKAKNPKEVAKKIGYDETSMSSARNGNRAFPDIYLNSLIEKYGLLEYYRAFQASPLINPFDAGRIENEKAQPAHSIVERLIRAETLLQKHADLIDGLYKKINALSMKDQLRK